MWVRYEHDWTKGREAMLQASELGQQMNGWMDRQTDHYRAPADLIKICDATYHLCLILK